MDIVKILTRGILKKSTRSAPATLPSAGAQPRPQLFHDNVGRGTKRKRPSHETTSGTGAGKDGFDEELSDIDYFASKKSQPEERSASVDLPAQPQCANAADDVTTARRQAELLSEDDCRQVHRSHRLKFTILAGRSGREDEETSSKKRKKDKTGKKKTESKTEEITEKGDKKKNAFYPQPLLQFADLEITYAVSPELAKNVARHGFKQPTEVQLGSLPLLLNPQVALKKSREILQEVQVDRGVDFVAVAPTGSGKTVTFLIPAIDGILKRRAEAGRARDEHVLEAIVVAPTRELAGQIVNEGRQLALGTGVRVVLMKKGMRVVADDGELGISGVEYDLDEDDSEEQSQGSQGEQHAEDTDGERDDVDRGASESDEASERKTRDAKKSPTRADVLVTTPKVLLNFLSRGKPLPRKTLSTVRSLVLDEADVLLDDIFRKQVLGIWKACTHPGLNISFFSATCPSSVETLMTRQVLKRAEQAGLQPKPLLRLVVGLKDTAVPNVTHKLVWCLSEAGKLYEIRNLLRPPSGSDAAAPLRPPFLVFTQTIERAKSLHNELQYDIPPEAGGSARIAVLHSALPDGARAAIMRRFRAGEIWVLITTDVLARGVDFAGVNGIVNYDVPGSAAAYIHRAGRTGRAGRAGGLAVTLWTKDDIPFVRSVANVIAASEKQAGGTAAADVDVRQRLLLLESLPKVSKEDKRRLKVRGVEARRAGGKAASITTQSSWERRRENNRLGAIEGSKRRKQQQHGQEKQRRKSGGHGHDTGEESEWSGLGD